MKKAVITISMVMITGVFGNLLSVAPPTEAELKECQKAYSKEEKGAVKACLAKKQQEKADADWARSVKQTEEKRIQEEAKAQEAKAKAQAESKRFVAVVNKTKGPIVVFVEGYYKDVVTNRITIKPLEQRVITGKDFQSEDSRRRASNESSYTLSVTREGFPAARKSFTTREDAKLFNVLEGSDNTLQIVE